MEATPRPRAKNSEGDALSPENRKHAQKTAVQAFVYCSTNTLLLRYLAVCRPPELPYACISNSRRRWNYQRQDLSESDDRYSLFPNADVGKGLSLLRPWSIFQTLEY